MERAADLKIRGAVVQARTWKIIATKIPARRRMIFGDDDRPGYGGIPRRAEGVRREP